MGFIMPCFWVFVGTSSALGDQLITWVNNLSPVVQFTASKVLDS